MQCEGESFLTDEPEVVTMPDRPALGRNKRLVLGLLAGVAPLGIIAFWGLGRSYHGQASISTMDVMQKIRTGSSAYAYQEMGYGACLLPDGNKPDNTYLSITEQRTLETCDGNADCKGYSQSTGCRGAYLYYNKDGTVKGGGEPIRDSHTYRRAHCNKKRLDWEYQVMGYGKCVRPDGSDPAHEYYEDMTEMEARRKCYEDPGCYGLSASRMNYNGILLWKEPALKVGGRESYWNVAYCLVKKAVAGNAANFPVPAPTPPPPAVVYRSLGLGKCLSSSGGNPRAKWIARGSEADVAQRCTSDPTCGGYSRSKYGGGLLWLETGLKPGGKSWGSCTCKVKR